MIHYYLATAKEDYQAAGRLFREYALYLNINLDFQHFNKELEALEKMYGAPDGGIILAKHHQVNVGCVAIRKFNDQSCELKRMYIQPGHQKMGAGKMLLQKALDLAKARGYHSIKLDTLDYMYSAIHLYKCAGFYAIAPYYANPMQSAVYFEKIL